MVECSQCYLLLASFRTACAKKVNEVYFFPHMRGSLLYFFVCVRKAWGRDQPFAMINWPHGRNW